MDANPQLMLETVLDRLLEVGRRFIMIPRSDSTYAIGVWGSRGGYVIFFDSNGSLLANPPRRTH